jgi:hypothetical protein
MAGRTTLPQATPACLRWRRLEENTMLESKKTQPVAPFRCKTFTYPLSTKFLYSLTLVLVQATSTFAIGSAPAKADAPCKIIQFEAGASSTKISGSIEPEATACFRFAAGNGQTVRIAIQSKDKNTIFSVLGLVDARDKYEFKSQKKTYEIVIGQLMKSVTPETYQLTLSIK